MWLLRIPNAIAWDCALLIGWCLLPAAAHGNFNQPVEKLVSSLVVCLKDSISLDLYTKYYLIFIIMPSFILATPIVLCTMSCMSPHLLWLHYMFLPTMWLPENPACALLTGWYLLPAAAHGKFNQPVEKVVSSLVVCVKVFLDHCPEEHSPLPLWRYST